MEQGIEQNEVQDDAEALAAALAGYNARGTTPPAETTEPSETPAAEAVEPASDKEPADPPEPTVAEKLEALKAEVKAMRDSSDPDAVRKLHGEIGNINRTIQELKKPAKEEAPAIDEVAAALSDAEKLSAEYPELAAPMLRAIKAIAAKTPQSQEPIDIDSKVSEKVLEIQRQNAREALQEEHPDWETVRSADDFKTWLSSKTPEYQHRFTTTWNPAVVSRGLSEFKESVAAKAKKQQRLEAAVTPQGVPGNTKPTVLPDDAGLAIGYNKGRKRLT